MEATRKPKLTRGLKIWNKELSQRKEHAYLNILNTESRNDETEYKLKVSIS